MGFRRERRFGFYGPRRWTFDIDDFLLGLLDIGLALFVAVWVYVTWLR